MTVSAPVADLVRSLVGQTVRSTVPLLVDSLHIYPEDRGVLGELLQTAVAHCLEGRGDRTWEYPT